jgi:flavin-dependent dehydrogenase
MYDAIVVGARCAGAATAMLLARKGYQVLLVDRATFPSDTWRLHFIHQPGVARLQRWGLLEQVAATCPPILKRTIDLGDFPLTGWAPPFESVAEAYSPRRFALDQILVNAATSAGAELREGFSVQDLVWSDDRVVGVRGQHRGSVAEYARVVIGADGLHSKVAQSVDATTYHARPARACHYAPYWSDVPTDGLEIYARDRKAVFVFPTNAGRTGICVGWQQAAFETVRANVEGSFQAALDLVPELADRVRRGVREEPFVGTADLPNFFRKPYGPGWALVGDAGYHKDPYLAQGITDAFRDAELLADALDQGFSGRASTLANYEQQRNARALPLYELNYTLAALEPPDARTLQLRAALRGNQADTNRFFGVPAGTVPVADFFAPANLTRILATASGGKSSGGKLPGNSRGGNPPGGTPGEIFPPLLGRRGGQGVRCERTSGRPCGRRADRGCAWVQPQRQAEQRLSHAAAPAARRALDSLLGQAFGGRFAQAVSLKRGNEMIEGIW